MNEVEIVRKAKNELNESKNFFQVIKCPRAIKCLRAKTSTPRKTQKTNLKWAYLWATTKM